MQLYMVLYMLCMHGTLDMLCMLYMVANHAGYFEVMFTQQVAPYNQNLGVAITSHMHMNWLLRSEAFLWYFLPPITSVLILWW